MSRRPGLARRAALSLVVAVSTALLAPSASAADVRVSVEPEGNGVLALTVDAGVEGAGLGFALVPLQDGRPSRTLAARHDRLRGTLDRRGRAAVDLRAVGSAPAGLAYQVVLLGAGGRPVGLSFASVSSFRATSLGPLTDAAPSSPLRITAPRAGATVGSPTIDVTGRLRGLLDAPGTQVTVNGVAADVLASPTAADRFVLANLELGAGANVVTVRAIAPNGSTFEETRTVTLSRLTSNNVVAVGGRAYAARGTAGLGIMDLATREFTTMPPVAGSNRVDDVSVADGFLFVLDAASGGRLSVLSLVDPDQPALVSGPVTVPVGPFAGVSAGGGRVVVSGGTGLLIARSYDAAGALSAAVASTDLGIGQPDVLVAPDGARAYVSTDFAGTVGGAGFGVTTIDLAAPPTPPSTVRRTGLPGSGFTGGFQSPANFPIESALIGSRLVTAHGGGLSRLTLDGVFAGTTPLSFAAVNVDGAGASAFVVGTERSLAEVDLGGASPTVVSTVTFPGPGAFSGVAATDEHIVISAGAGGLRVLRR